MNMYWFGMTVLGFSFILWGIWAVYWCLLVANQKTKQERSLELKGLHNVASYAAITGFGLMFLAYLFMPKNERALLETTTAQSLKPPPIIVSWRPSRVGASNVLQIRNTSTQSVDNIVIRVENAKRSAKDEYTIRRLDPGNTEELGFREWKWNLQRDDVVTIFVDGYTTETYREK